jgi:polyisoprenoid-binding protein YceI
MTTHTLDVRSAWTIDLTQTTASFAVREFGLHTVVGTVPVTAVELATDTAGRVTGVHAELDPAGVDTGNPRRDADLRSGKFFAVDETPRWRFAGVVSQRWPGHWDVAGTLTARQPVPVDLTVHRADDPGADDVRVLVATGTIDRRAAGVSHAPGFVIGHRVTVSLTVTARRRIP